MSFTDLFTGFVDKPLSPFRSIRMHSKQALAQLLLVQLSNKRRALPFGADLRHFTMVRGGIFYPIEG